MALKIAERYCGHLGKRGHTNDRMELVYKIDFH